LPSLPGFPAGLEIASGGPAWGVQPGLEGTAVLQLLITGLTNGNLNLGEQAFPNSGPSGDENSPAEDLGARPDGPARKLGAAGGSLLLNVEPKDHLANPAENQDVPNEADELRPDDDFLSNLNRFPNATDQGLTEFVALMEQPDGNQAVYKRSTAIDLPLTRSVALRPLQWIEIAAEPSALFRLPAEPGQPLELTDAGSRISGSGQEPDEPMQPPGDRQPAAGAANEDDAVAEPGGDQSAAAESPEGSRATAVAVVAAIVGLCCWLPRMASDCVHVLWRPRIAPGRVLGAVRTHHVIKCRPSKLQSGRANGAHGLTRLARHD
jgi:hypothetical protein